MTSLRQIISNRENALRSTGPRSEAGKRRSSQNARRHGLTAETVIEPIEDIDDYKAFEASVTAEYDAETAIERELVLRLASLLWRLRRAGAIETGLMQIEQRYEKLDRGTKRQQPALDTSVVEIARCFLGLPAHAFALLGRYEASLWRQVRQTIFTLDTKLRRAPPRKWPIHTWRSKRNPLYEETPD
jgi:hypothetical protein